MVTIHPRVTKRHPDLTEKDILFAWDHALFHALRMNSPNFPEYVVLGVDAKGRTLEMVGTQTESGWLIYHAMTPPSKKTVVEIESSRRRS